MGSTAFINRQLLFFYPQSNHTRRTPEFRGLVYHNCCLHSLPLPALLCLELKHFNTLDWANMVEPGLGSWNPLQPHECHHDNYQSTLGWRSCLIQQGWHFPCTILSSLLAVVSRSGWRILITACWLIPGEELGFCWSLIGRWRNTDKKKLMMTTLEILTTSMMPSQLFIKHHLGANWDTWKWNKFHEWKL